MPVKRPVCLICLIFLFIIYIATGAAPPSPSWDIDRSDGKTIGVTGKVCDRQEKNGSFQVFLKEVSFSTSEKGSSDQTYFPKRSKGIVVKLADTRQWEEIRLGSVIEAKGIFAPFERARCEGQFDARSYYTIKGYDGQLKRARITGISEKYSIIKENLRKVRDRACDILYENMDEEDAGLCAAMTLGDKTGLDEDIKQLYQNAGISHVLALSGLHIASLGLALLSALKKLGIKQIPAAVSVFALIAVYALMTGMSTSTKRALVMFGIFAASALFGRTYDLLSSAALSAIVILIISPYQIYDTGFLLSFGAVLGIACIFPILSSLPAGLFAPIRKTHAKKEKRIPVKAVGDSVCISVSVTIATLPVMGNSFMQLSVFSVLINIVVVPLMSFVLFTGFSGMTVGFSGVNPGWIFKITSIILRLYRTLAEIFEKIDGNILLIGKAGKAQTITYAIIMISVVIAHNLNFNDNDLITHMKKSIDRTGRRIANNNGNYCKKSENKITYRIETENELKKKNKKSALFSTITIVTITLSFVVMLVHPRRDIEVRNVDVGQGDCSLIWGDKIPTVMIDGGSSDVRQAGKYRILPVLKANRVTVIDYCFLSHMDNDHVNAVMEMLNDTACPVKIKRVIISSVSAANGSNENLTALRKVTGAGGAGLYVMSAGDVIEESGLKMTCISPSAYPSRNDADENGSSLVISMEYTGNDNTVFRALFTGDIGEETEKALLSCVGPVSYLKVAHHGSRFSSSDAFLKRVRPVMAVISCGVDNSYGHPHAEALERLEKNCANLFRTDASGEVIMTVDDGTMSVRTVIDKQEALHQ